MSRMDEPKFVLIMGIYSKPIDVLTKYQNDMIKHVNQSKYGSQHEAQKIVDQIKNFERAINELKKNDKHEIG